MRHLDVRMQTWASPSNCRWTLVRAGLARRPRARSRWACAVTALAVLAAAPAAAQSSRAAQAAAAARALVLTVQVTSTSGQSLDGVKVNATGAVSREGLTDQAGLARLSGMKPGNYRLRLEKEGFVTLEKEVTLKPGASIAVDASLTAAPPPPPPLPAPAPAPAPLGTPGEPRTLSLSDYIEKNLIAREPIKQSTLGCSGVLQSVLLQVRDPLAEQTDDQLDQTIYVVAGQGQIRLGGRESSLVPASFAVIPRGTAFSLTRRGNTPLIVLLTRANEPCTAG